MPSYRENFVRLLYAIILAQFGVIAVLLGGLSSEYLSNDYYKGWVTKNVPVLGFLLHGEVSALFIGIALGGTILLIQRRKDAAKTQPGEPGSLRPSPRPYVPVPVVKSQAIQDPAIPNDTAPTRKKDLPQEKPEDILAELERHGT